MASLGSSLSGKVAIITGASKGIGKASALALARLGATVVINYSSDEKAANQALAEVQGLNSGEARLIRADVSTIDGVQSLVKQTVEAYSKVDILVPNAGVLAMKDLEHTTEADFDRTFALNVKGPYFLAQVSKPSSQLFTSLLPSVDLAADNNNRLPLRTWPQARTSFSYQPHCVPPPPLCQGTCSTIAPRELSSR